MPNQRATAKPDILTAIKIRVRGIYPEGGRFSVLESNLEQGLSNYLDQSFLKWNLCGLPVITLTLFTT